ncbi:MAG: glutamate--tRNA ligase family protein [Gemmatimonadales bacterium]
MEFFDADAIRARYRQFEPQPPRLVTRFAPSPTGHLHLGHVLHAEWVWGAARALDARVVIRMEDHDRSRCRPEFERSILKDLRWLGFQPDAISLNSLQRADSGCRQSSHPRRYQAAFDRLRTVTGVYGCICTREMMAPVGTDGERRYAGTCRGQPIERDRPAVLRAQLPDDAVPIEDLRHGSLVQHPQRDRGDVAVRDARGQWTYQFSVVVDDLHDGVNLVVRGDDLLPSTGTQRLLARLLGHTGEAFTIHHPLVRDATGHKLSKRDSSETVQELRRSGLSAVEVRRRAQAAVGGGAPVTS